jgi:hypothetical protein
MSEDDGMTFDHDLPENPHDLPTIHVEQVMTHPELPYIGFIGDDGAVMLHFQNDDHMRWTLLQIVEALDKRA